MMTMNFMTAWICQVDSQRKLRVAFVKWLRFGQYLLMPEDSRDSVYREPTSTHPDDLPRCAATIKFIICVALALAMAVAISRLQ